MDRLGQLSLIGMGLTGFTIGLKCAFRGIAKTVSASPRAGAAVVAITFMAVAARMVKALNPNLAPADVMPKKSK